MEGSSFPVVFYDGEQEISLGNVVVSPYMSLKRFQSLLGEKIGISQHQLCFYLEDGKGSRVPVTSRLNVSAFSREKGWFFLVALKRSPRQWSMMVLRRDGNNVAIGGFDPRVARVGFEKRLVELEMARERYFMDMGLDGPSLGGVSVRNGGGDHCEECLRGGGGKRDYVEFHSCVNDAVTFGFRSPAGPIARPKKESC